MVQHQANNKKLQLTQTTAVLATLCEIFRNSLFSQIHFESSESTVTHDLLFLVITLSQKVHIVSRLPSHFVHMQELSHVTA